MLVNILLIIIVSEACYCAEDYHSDYHHAEVLCCHNAFCFMSLRLGLMICFRFYH